jgi:serine/threonine protein kinase/tetratricopeptide (TPR) repeat protein
MPLTQPGALPAALSATGSDRLLAQIGRYGILAPLPGGMAVVYRAWDPAFLREVLIKLPKRGGPSEDWGRICERFAREMRAAARVEHPHVCPVFDSGTHDGAPYGVMRFVPGQSLAELLQDQEGRFDARRSVRLAIDVAEGLAATHAERIVHQDLKPANVMVDRKDRAILTDLGVCRFLDDPADQPAAGTLVGTISYMAPEQAAGDHGRVGTWTDVYGLGAVLYRMLTGRVPFEGPPESVVEQIIQQAPPPPSRFRTDLDRNLEKIVLKAMARTPEGRYPDAHALSDALTEWLRDSDEVETYLEYLPGRGEHFVGRDREMAWLDRAWQGQQKRNVVSIVAFGGAGKSALVGRWLNRMASDNYRGARRVFTYTFYREGASGKLVSTDTFFQEALAFFGDPNPADGSPKDRARRLARLVRRQRALLVLDGIEPLQYLHGNERGRIQDIALAALVRELASVNPGLLVLTTREKVADLDTGSKVTTDTLSLDPLSAESGADLLRRLGVTGPDRELQQTSSEVNNHPLTLTLLGTFLRKAHHGDVRARVQVRLGDADRGAGGYAWRVMEAYAQWFGEGPELCILRAVSLFDRPADRASLLVLRVAPGIPHLTDRLVGLSEPAWQHAVNTLRECGLLIAVDPTEPDTLDAHPLVREFFGERVRADFSEAWKAGHDRLYQYLKRRRPRGPEPTLDEIMPLYAAVIHGCHAGRALEALKEVYWPHIQQGRLGYSHRRLGAFSAELAMLSALFAVPWTVPVDGLSPFWRATVLGIAGSRLRAVGRLGAAVEPLRLSLEAHIDQEEFNFAAVRARHLAELHLEMGNLGDSLDYARLALELADKSDRDLSRPSHYENEGVAPRTLNDVLYERVIERTVVATAHHHLGEWENAHEYFAEAEKLMKVTLPSLPVLFTLWGFRYCNLFIDDLTSEAEPECRAERCAALRSRVRQMRDLSEDLLKNLLPEGTLGLLRAGLEGLIGFQVDWLCADGPARAEGAGLIADVNRAVEDLRRAKREDFVPFGLLARAAYRRAQGEFDQAWADLTEALDVARRGSMRVHEADCHLELARIHIAQGSGPDALERLGRAQRLVDDMKYYRRNPELNELRRRAERLPSGAGGHTEQDRT